MQRVKITVLACSEPPEGYAQWSLRLLADKAVELGYVEGISHTEVRKILKKTLTHLKRAWRLRKPDSRFLARMETSLIPGRE